MKVALLRLFSSMKTWTLIFGITLTPAAALLAKHGLNISDDTVKLLAELMSLGFTGLLVAQGLTDQGKEAAKFKSPNVQNVAGGDLTVTPPAPPSTPPSGRISVGLVIALAMMTVLVACSWLKSTASHEAEKLVDCTASQIAPTIKELRPLADDLLVEATGGDGKVDYARVESAGRNFAGNIGMCLIADAVTRALTPAPTNPSAPKASPLVADPASLKEVFGRLRNQRGPGKSYKTETGTL